MNRQWEMISKEMRKDCLLMAQASGDQGMHFGGTLSMIEIAAALYLGVGNIFPENYEERDRVIVSKGHGMPAIYAALHLDGRISEEELKSFKHDETELYAHPSMNRKLGIEFSSGSLGQGLSQGVGVALALRQKRNAKSRVYVILGDGECNEGSVWEAAMSAKRFCLNQICAIIDYNKLQYDGSTQEIMDIEPFQRKWQSFGWDVIEVDGHDIKACCNAFATRTEKPLAVIADTVKGKGISFMENEPKWHFGRMTAGQYEQAWKEIEDGRVLS